MPKFQKFKCDTLSDFQTMWDAEKHVSARGGECWFIPVVVDKMSWPKHPTKGQIFHNAFYYSLFVELQQPPFLVSFVVLEWPGEQWHLHQPWWVKVCSPHLPDWPSYTIWAGVVWTHPPSGFFVGTNCCFVWSDVQQHNFCGHICHACRHTCAFLDGHYCPGLNLRRPVGLRKVSFCLGHLAVLLGNAPRKQSWNFWYFLLSKLILQKKKGKAMHTHWGKSPFLVQKSDFRWELIKSLICIFALKTKLSESKKL